MSSQCSAMSGQCSAMSGQCSATEPQQPDNHQPSQSSMYTAQVVLNASVVHLAATQYGLWGLVVVLQTLPINKPQVVICTTQNCQCQQRHIDYSPCQHLMEFGSVLDPLIWQALKLTTILTLEAYICNRFRLMFSMYVNLPDSRIISKGHIAVCMLWGSHDVKFGGGAVQTGLHHFHNH